MELIMNGSIEYLNPDKLNKNPAFTNVIVVQGNTKTVYIAGQNSVNENREIIGRGDIKAQTEQVLINLLIALKAGGAKLEDVIKLNVYIVHGQHLQSAYLVFQNYWGNRQNPPTLTLLYVSGLANTDFLIEMDAIAVVPE